MKLMSPHPPWTDLVGIELAARPRPREADAAPGWSARLSARFFAARYDQELDSGVNPLPGTALAVHCARLASAAERADLARALRLAAADAAVGAWTNPRVPVHRDAVKQAADVVEEVLSKLDEPQGVRVRGMARLRMLLSDGRGPLYRSGSGSLNAALRGVLAAL
jgi:hypothetical protein